MASDDPRDAKLRAIASSLAAAEFFACFIKEQNTWVLTSARSAHGADAIDREPLPDGSVLDFAAGKSGPTYLPQGEEGSDWCLMNARSTLFIPVIESPDSGLQPIVYYIVGRTTDAFSPREIQQAFESVNRSARRPSGFPKLDPAMRLARLQPPDKRVRVVIDTDTKNDIDDIFALAYALLSPDKIQSEAIYAAPFHNARSTGPRDGMEQSYNEIVRLLERFDRSSDIFVYRGATQFLTSQDTPSNSPAATDLVERALESPLDDPLYVIGIGAATNIASAILIEPSIIERIVVLWLGGHAYHWPDTKEFNLWQDVHAARILFDCGVPLIHFPCRGVTSHLATTVPEMKQHMAGRHPFGDYLYRLFEDHMRARVGSLSKVLWDLAPVAYLVEPEGLETDLRPGPGITDELTWNTNFDPKSDRHLIRYAWYVYRDDVFGSLFEKLS